MLGTYFRPNPSLKRFVPRQTIHVVQKCACTYEKQMQPWLRWSSSTFDFFFFPGSIKRSTWEPHPDPSRPRAGFHQLYPQQRRFHWGNLLVPRLCGKCPTKVEWNYYNISCLWVWRIARCEISLKLAALYWIMFTSKWRKYLMTLRKLLP